MNIISVCLDKGLQMLTIHGNTPPHITPPEKTLGYRSRGRVTITSGEGVEAENCVFNNFKLFFFPVIII